MKRRRLLSRTCGERHEGLRLHKLPAVVQEVLRVKPVGGFPLSLLIQHRVQVLDDQGSLWRKEKLGWKNLSWSAGIRLGLEFLSRKTIQQCHPGQEVSHELRVGGGAVVDAQGDGVGYPQDLVDHSLEEKDKKVKGELEPLTSIL